MSKPLLEVNNLSKQFKIGKHMLKAVNNLSFSINTGETIGMVGESGCGKSTAGRTILKFFDEYVTGEVLYNGKNVYKISKSELFELRKEMQMIFQDPYSSLNSRMTVKNIIEEPLAIHKIGTKVEREKRIDELLYFVGLKNEHKNRFAHEFSGGQRQRICIARALALNPKFIVCDEPISSLDVSIQAQVVNLLKELQEKLNLTYLFITHDLSMVRYISDKIIVMYLGNMVEYAESEKICTKPMHPYTEALLSAVPVPDPGSLNLLNRQLIEGEIPNPMDPPSGCVFRTRCIKVMNKCSKVVPTLKEVEEGHFVQCLLYE